MIKSHRLKVLLLSLGLLAGCHQATFVPEPEEPTQQEMQRLLNLPVKVKPLPPTKFSFSVFPAVIMSGESIKLTCIVPEEMKARTVNIGIVGLEQHGGPVDHIENTFIINHVPCGELVAFCNVHMELKDQILTQPFSAMGCQ